ncbi:MAG: synthetase, partial [Moraxellaceae bacterium]|nr:synthetase [Moraxellaceae bacterium]
MTDAVLRIAIAQADFLVGDIPGNMEKILGLAVRARDEQEAGIVVFPELALCGYPPEDLLLRPSLDGRVEAALARLAEVGDIHILLGYPARREGRLCNLAGVWRDGQCLLEYAKQELPNYQVFDEKRYFAPGTRPAVLDLCGHRVGITICEDIWHEGPAQAAREAGAELLININASPFHQGKQAERMAVVGTRVRDTKLPVVYVNTV